jgi:4-amino-4-deoxy-L-arabinose transferase-like glycosyltransferase
VSTVAPHSRAAPGFGSAIRARVAVAPVAVALVGLAGFVGLLAALTWGTWGDLDSDTGYETIAGTRVADGQLPYRDFIYFYGPLAPALVGLASLLGGAGIGSTLAVGIVVTAAILAATFLLGRILAGVTGAVFATAITAAVAFTPDNYNYMLPHTNAATLGTAFMLAILLSLWSFASTGHERWLVLAGLGLGLVTLTKPEPILGAFLALGAWFLVTRRDGGLRRRLALVAAPAVAISAAVYGPLLALVGPERLLFENLYPLDFLDAAGDFELRNRMPLTFESLVQLGGKLALYAIGAAGLLLLGNAIARGGRLRVVAAAMLAVGATLAVAGALVNPEALRHGLQFAYGWIPAGAIVALLMLLRRTPARATPAAQLRVALVAALGGVAVTVYTGFFPHAPHEQMAVYYMPLAALFVVTLHVIVLPRTRAAMAVGVGWLAFLALAGGGLALKDARADSIAVKGHAGTLSESPESAKLYQDALGWIERSTAPGEPIFVAPMMTGLYALSGRNTPLEEISMLPGALPSPADERRAIAVLDAANVRLILTDDRRWPGYGHGAFGETFDRDLSRWIETTYERVTTLTAAAHVTFEGDQAARTISVWLRRNR